MIEPPAIRVALVPSRRLALGLCALHAATLAVLWAAAPSPWAGIFLSAMVALHAVWSIRLLALLRHPRSVVALLLQCGQSCLLVLRDGRSVVEATIDSSTIVTGSLVVVGAAPVAGGLASRRRYRFAIVRGMLADDAFRQVRVLLKWGAGHETREDRTRAAA